MSVITFIGDHTLGLGVALVILVLLYKLFSSPGGDDEYEEDNP